MTKIINILGGPGVGKSTISTGVFSKLKASSVNCEYVSEFAKDIVWEGTHSLLENQLYVFAEQFRRQFRLLGKVDYVITDSPLILSPIYFEMYRERNKFFTEQYSASLKQHFLDTFNLFDNINIYVSRNKHYVQVGRNQTENEARDVDQLIHQYLTTNQIPFSHTDSQFGVNFILNSVFDYKL